MDDLHEIRSFFRTEFLALSFLGAIVALSFWPPTGRKAAAINIAAGTIVACLSAPVVTGLLSYYLPNFPMSKPIEGAAFFWMGMFGMRIVPKVSSMLDGLKITGRSGE